MDATNTWIDSDGERDYNMNYVNITEMVEGSGTGNLMRIEHMEWALDADISDLDSYEDVSGKKVAEERPTGEWSGNDPYFD